MRRAVAWLKKFIIEYWREGILLAAAAGFVTLGYYFTYERPENTVLQGLMLIGMAASATLGVLALRWLWRKKWRDCVTERFQKVFSRLQKVVESLSKRFGFGNREKKSLLSGKTKVIFEKKGELDRVRHAAEKKPPKWRQLEDDRQRLRYLYRGNIKERIGRGERIYCNDTPSELLERSEEGSAERSLIGLYVECRYDERKKPDSTEIARIKRELDIK